jgi:glycerophosphoryl diester phosphodiesterase
VFSDLPRPLLMAHRGASSHAPENTMAAFDLAVRLGAPVLELDVRASRDGELVVMHDATLERTTDGTGSVREHTWEEIAALDAGHHFERNGLTLFRDRGQRVPRLADVLAAFPEVGLNIELKDRGMTRAVLDAVEGHPHVLLAAHDDDTMAELVAEQPACALGLSFSEARATVLGAYRGRVPAKFRGRALQVPPRHSRFAFGLLPIVTRRVLRGAHDAGVEVHLWTINEVEEAAHWLKLGVDGLFSDDVGTMLDLFGDGHPIPRTGDGHPIPRTDRNAP